MENPQITLPHKKKSQWHISPKKYNIYLYIIISTPIPPKNRPFLGKVFSEYFLRQTTNRHTFLCGSVGLCGNEMRHFAPDFSKKVDTHFSRRYREDIERIDKKNADPKIRISTHPHTFKSRSVSVTILHYYIKKRVETKISLLSGFIYECPQSYDNF